MKRSALPFGAGTIRPGKMVANSKLAANRAKGVRAITATVVGKQAPDGNAQCSKVVHRSQQKSYRRLIALTVQDPRKSQARVVVNGNMDELPADAAGVTAAIAGDASRCNNAPGS